MEAQNGQDVEMKDAEQQQQQQQPQPQPQAEPLPEEAQAASSSLSQLSSDPIPQSTSLTSQAQPNQETQDEPSFDAEDEEVDEDADETQEGQDQDQDQEEEEDGETNTDAAPSEDGAASEGGSPSKDDPDKSKASGRPRGRPPGAGSKVHRGNGRGPLTLSRRARGRPRGPNARPLGPGPHIHEGNIVRGTPAVGAEGGEGTEDGEAAEPSNFGGKINVGGKEYELQGDELALDPDEDGDKKIDAKGNLLGGREWKIHAFCSPMRPDPECVYLLSIDAARAAGYRDSLYFFRKNPLLVKLNLMQGEKDVLIDGGRLSGTLRGRNVTMVAARNVFKLHGPRIVKNGRAVTDDYYEAKARAAGKREGEKVGPAEADDPAAARRELDKQRASARKARDIHLHQSTDHNGEPVYTQFCDSGEAPFVRAEGWLLRKQQLARSDITEKNWKMEMAKSVRGINREITEARRSRKEGWEWDWEGGQPSSAREDLEKEESESREIIGKLTGTPRISSGGSQQVNSGKDIGSLGYTRRSHLPGNQNDSRSSTPNTASKRALEEKEETKSEPKKIRTEEPPLGVYDPYTGQVHFPKSLQSERARLEKISARARFEAPPGSYSSSKSTAPILGGLRVGREAWGLASFDHYLSDPNPPPFPASREGNVVIPGGEPMNDGEEEVEVNRASVVPGATEEQESRETPDPNASAATGGGQNAGSLASNAPQNRVGPNKKLGRAGQGLVARAAMWKAR